MPYTPVWKSRGKSLDSANYSAPLGVQLWGNCQGPYCAPMQIPIPSLMPTCAVGAIALIAACGQPVQDGAASAEILARAPVALVPCLPGVDADGDGDTDYFQLANTRPTLVASVPGCFRSGGTPLEYRSPSRARRALTLAVPQGPVALPANPYTEGGDLPSGVGQDVNDTGVPDPEGWREGEHDCDDFASDLERALDDLGYDATYTEICMPGSPKATWHSITDIHLEGTTYWVDGQTGLQVKLDANGDGVVGTSTSGSPCATATEGGWGVRVWPDRAARLRELGAVD